MSHDGRATCRTCGSTHPTACRYCGCTDDDACDGDCYWVPEDCCSSCDDALADLERDVEQLLYEEVGWSVPEIADGLREIGLRVELVLERIVITTPGGPLSLYVLGEQAEGDSPLWRWTEPGSATELTAGEGGGLVSTLAELAWAARCAVKA